MNGRTIIIVSTGGLLLILVAVGIALLSGRKLTLSLPVARHGVAAGAAWNAAPRCGGRCLIGQAVGDCGAVGATAGEAYSAP